MNWLISIHLYLWRNSIRRWYEQPLSLLSKLTVSGLLGVLGAIIILGTKDLGKELDKSLSNPDILTAVVSDYVAKELATGSLVELENNGGSGWSRFGSSVSTFYLTSAVARTPSGEVLPVYATANLSRLRLVDDFYIASEAGAVGERVSFNIADRWSEATRVRPDGVVSKIAQDRPVFIGGLERLSPVLSNGYTELNVIQARSLEEIERIHLIADTIFRLEGRQTYVRSSRDALRQLESIRSLQARALVGVSVGASAVLGLVFGSLVWMEFREERYLLSLMRSFGVGRLSLLGHSVAENVILAVAGVLLGFLALHLGAHQFDVASIKMPWLMDTADLAGREGRLLVIGAALGGFFSCIPIGFALRRQLGLVLN